MTERAQSIVVTVAVLAVCAVLVVLWLDSIVEVQRCLRDLAC